MKDITKKLIMGASGVGAMALVGLLLGKKDNSEEEHNDNEVVLDESLVPDEESETEEDTQEENVEE